MDFFWLMFEMAVNIGEYIIVFVLLRAQLSTLGKKSKAAMFFILPLAAFTTVMNNLGLNMELVICISAVLIICYSVAFFGSSITRRLLCGAVPSIVFLVSNLIVFMILSFVTSNAVESLTSSTLIRAESILLYLLCNVTQLFALLAIKRKFKVLPFQQSITLTLIITLGVMGVALLINLSFVLALNNLDTIVCVILCPAILIISVNITYFFNHIVIIYQHNLDMQKQIQQTEAATEYLLPLESTYNFIREWRHNINNSMSTLASFAQT
ncbi:MAG: hypothetical protein RR352_04630 [Clostridia bacterium]